MIFFKGLDILKKLKKGRPEAAPCPDPSPEQSKMSESPMEQEQKIEQQTPKRRERIRIDLLIHDLKVPLAVIEAGIVSLLQRRDKYGSLTDGQEKVLTRVLRNTRVTQRLVTDALELGRSREGIVNPIPCRISDFIEQALIEIFDLTDCSTSDKVKTCKDLHGLRSLLQEKGIALSVDEVFWHEDVCMDPAKTNQILRNLLNNALKYRRNRVELKVDRTDSYLVFSVKDDGEGIPAEYHNKIFQCYFQMNNTEGCPVRGHGLGLAGVMVLVEDLGGQLFLDSDVGRGARFLVKLPLAKG